MKLKLEVFQHTSILVIEEALTIESIKVLFIGFRRLQQLKCKFLIVNLTDCSIESGVLDFFVKARSKLEKSFKCLLLVGPSPALCHYNDMVEAFHECKRLGALDADLLMARSELQQKYEDLSKQIESTRAEELMKLSPAEQNEMISGLRKESQRLKKLQAYYIDEMVRHANLGHSLKGRVACDELKTQMIEVCKSLKLISEEKKEVA